MGVPVYKTVGTDLQSSDLKDCRIPSRSGVSVKFL